MYTIKALSRITGIPPNTLRSWERRYGIPGPVRDDMGFRLYSADDASHLSLVGRLISAGHSIGKLAALSRSELEELERLTMSAGPEDGCDVLRRRMIDAIHRSDIDHFRQSLTNALITCSPVDVCTHILTPALEEIGLQWQKGKLNVALEHVYSALTKQLLYSTVNVLQWASSKPRLAFATLPGELHELGCLMAYFIAAARGHRCTYFGPNVPTDALASAVSAAGARALVISIVLPEDETSVARHVQRLRGELGKDIGLWIGSRFELRGIGDTLHFPSFEPYDKHLAALC